MRDVSDKSLTNSPATRANAANANNNNEDSLQAERLQALGVLASSVAHDLNNILTSVLGHVSYLRVSDGELGPPNPSLQAIEEGARRAAAITQQILEFSRGQRATERDSCMEEVTRKVSQLFCASLPPNIELQVQVGHGSTWILVDESQMSQVVINLLVNARDALPNGGRIRIECGRERLQTDAECKRFQLAPGEYGVLKISDNGHGIPREVRDRIFEPFFTTKADHGTGLGLAIVGSVVRQAGGAIAVATEESKGTSFRILFPLAKSKSRPVTQSPEEEVPGGCERILVVDDEESVRTIIQRSLEHLGYKVCVAENGEQALDSFGSNPGQFKLIIIDMIMPQMPGDELFSKLKELDANVPVLVASGYSSDNRTRNILDHGGLGFIQKPFAIEELAREVRRCLDAQQR